MGHWVFMATMEDRGDLKPRSIIMHGWWTSQCKVHMMMENDWCVMEYQSLSKCCFFFQIMEYQSLSNNHYPIDDDGWRMENDCFFSPNVWTHGTRKAPSTADRSPWTAWNGAFRYGGPGPAGRLEGLQGTSRQFVWETWAGPYIYVYIDIDIHIIRRYLLKKSWTHNFWTLPTNSWTKIRKGTTLGLSNTEAEDEDKFNPRFRPLPHDEDKAPNHPTFQKLGPGGGKGPIWSDFDRCNKLSAHTFLVSKLQILRGYQLFSKVVQ